MLFNNICVYFHMSRHHTPTSYGVNAMYEEVTLPRTPADHKDGGIQAATTEMATYAYSSPDCEVKIHF